MPLLYIRRGKKTVITDLRYSIGLVPTSFYTISSQNGDVIKADGQMNFAQSAYTVSSEQGDVIKADGQMNFAQSAYTVSSNQADVIKTDGFMTLTPNMYSLVTA